LEGVDFLVTACGHAFCLDCEQDVLQAARCFFCEVQLTDHDIDRHLANAEKPHLTLCGYDPSKIMTIASRAMNFWESQCNVRSQVYLIL